MVFLSSSKYRGNIPIRRLKVPSKSFPIDRSSIALIFDATVYSSYVVQKKNKNKSKKKRMNIL
jgi:hypothetical protein